MSYKYDGICRTQKGKVTYTRKVHLWNGKDLIRIVKLLKDPENDYQLFYLLEAFMLLGNHLSRIDSDFLDTSWKNVKDYCFKRQFKMEDYFQFSGGTFSGAGATRPF